MGVNDLAGGAQQGLAVFCQRHGARRPIYQGLAEGLLQPPDLLAYGRLGPADDLRRSGEAAGIRDGEEGAVEFDIHQGLLWQSCEEFVGY